MNIDQQVLKPTFLGIGSQRCASSWLYRILRQHPEIQVSRPKELNFFLKLFVHKEIESYFNYFQPPAGKSLKAVRGEISPQYARLGIQRVREIAKLIPDLKIVIIIRHPIKRSWSGVCYELGYLQEKQLDLLSDMSYLLHLSRPRSRYYSYYARTIRIWQEVFGKEAVLVCLQEDIRKNPQEILLKIFSHIGASTDYMPNDEKIDSNINTTVEKTKQNVYEIPESVEWYLAQQLLPEVHKLNILLNNQVQNWVDEFEILAQNNQLDWRFKRYVVDYCLGVPDEISWFIIEKLRDFMLSYKVFMYSSFREQGTGNSKP